MMVSHGNEIDMIRPHVINYIERETVNDSLAEFAGERGTGLRVSDNSFRCLLDGRQKPEAKPVKPRLIEIN